MRYSDGWGRIYRFCDELDVLFEPVSDALGTAVVPWWGKEVEELLGHLERVRPRLDR